METESHDYLLTIPETTAFLRATPQFWENPKNVEMMQEVVRRAYYDEREPIYPIIKPDNV